MGFFDKIVSDKGKEFNNSILKALYKVCGIKKLSTSGWHPQTNGQVERFNRVLASMLAKKCAHHQDQWPSYLPTIMLVYNATPHSATGESPYYLEFGQECWFPWDLDLKLLDTGISNWQGLPFPEHLARIQKSIHNIAKAHRVNGRYYNDRRLPNIFRVGDMVLVATHVTTKTKKGFHKKLALNGTGPY